MVTATCQPSLSAISKAMRGGGGQGRGRGWDCNHGASPTHASLSDVCPGKLSSSCVDALSALACSRLASGSAQVKLSTKSFGTEAAGVAADAIANCAASLTHADLSDVIAGRPEAEALAALRILSNALAQVGCC